MALSKAKAALIVSNIDIIGLTMTIEMETGTNTSPTSEAVVSILASIRKELTNTYNLDISAVDSFMGTALSKCLTPEETAELMLEEINAEIE